MNCLVAAAGIVLCLPAAVWPAPPGRPAAGAGAPDAQEVGLLAPSPAAAPPAELTFRHGSHLSPQWSQTARKDQFAAHCKVCHDFEAKAPLGLAPVTKKCAACHFNDPARPEGNAQRLVLKGEGQPPRDRQAVYDHSLAEHQKRACIDCHAFAAGPRGDFRHPDVLFSMPGSLAVCADCHHHGAEDPAKTLQTAVHKAGATAAWRSKWDGAGECGDCHKAGAPRLLDGHRRAVARGFEHASHVPPQDLGPDSKGLSCKGCHAIDGAASAAAMGIEQKSCGECHFADQGAKTTELVADLQVQRMPTQFSHQQEGHTKACSVCHPMAAGARDPEVGRMYADCTKTCHTERRVERHGAWACTDCHANASPKPGGADADNHEIATVAVQRPAAASAFAFARTRHPGVTGSGAAVHPVANGRACADCHRRTVEGLARPTAARPFTHEGHVQALSPETPNTACTTCHASVRETTSAEFVSAFRADSGEEARSCTVQCHQSPHMDVTAAVAKVEVPVFSHAQHGARACAECHVGPAGVTDLRGAQLVGETAFACARCHGHKDPEKIKVTGGYATTKESDTCGQCHVAKKEGQYRKEVRREQRFQLAGDARQFHDKGGDCRTCHSYEDAGRVRATTAIRVESHLDVHMSHPGVPAVKTAKGQCLSCHAWQPRDL